MVLSRGFASRPADFIGVVPRPAPVGAFATAGVLTGSFELDQDYPAGGGGGGTNGKKRIFALQQATGVPPTRNRLVPDHVAWSWQCGGCRSRMANTTFRTTFMGTFSPVGVPNPAIAF